MFLLMKKIAQGYVPSFKWKEKKIIIFLLKMKWPFIWPSGSVDVHKYIFTILISFLFREGCDASFEQTWIHTLTKDDLYNVYM